MLKSTRFFYFKKTKEEQPLSFPDGSSIIADAYLLSADGSSIIAGTYLICADVSSIITGAYLICTDGSSIIAGTYLLSADASSIIAEASSIKISVSFTFKNKPQRNYKIFPIAAKLYANTCIKTQSAIVPL